MSSQNSIITTFENFPKIAKVLLLIFVGIISGIYRIIRYTETKNNATLVAGILAFVPVVGFIIQVLDVVSEIFNNEITFYV
jgi:uncharacterized membrane protein